MANVCTALTALRSKLDSPQRREAARLTLSVCKQKEDESVAQFLKRLIPLVEVTNPGLVDEARKEKICEELRGRLKPSLTNMMRLLGTAQMSNLQKFKERAEEVEAVLQSDKGLPTQIEQVVNVLRNQGKTLNLNANTQPNNNFNRRFEQPNFRRFIREDAQNRNPQAFNQNYRGTNSNRINIPARGWSSQQMRSERNWTGRTRCYNCNRAGHVARECRLRRNNFQANWPNRNNYDSQQTSSQQQYKTNSYPKQQNSVNTVQSSMTVVPVEELLQALGSMNIKSTDTPMEELRSVTLNNKKSAGKEDTANDKTEPAVKQRSNIISKTTNWEGLGPKITKFSLGLLMLLTMIIPASGTINHPLICQTQAQNILWELPNFETCSNKALNHSIPPVSKRFEIYLPNDLEHEIEAWACRKVKKSFRKYTSITGVPIQEEMSSEPMKMSEEECKQMIEHGKCSLGILKNDSGILYTENKIDLSPRFWFVGSFNWKQVSSENCYLFKTTITSKFGDKSIKTTLGNTKCEVTEEKCLMADETLLKWKVGTQQNCEYTKVGTWNGTQLDNVWISEEINFRLTFPAKPAKAFSCNVGLILSVEGPAVRDITPQKAPGLIKSENKGYGKIRPNNLPPWIYIRRRKRAIEGWVSESELDAKLSYLDAKMSEMMTVSFSQALKSICDYMEETRRWATATILKDPTSFARAVFQEEKLVAKRVSSSIISVWPCIQLNWDEYEFTRVYIQNGKTECFDQLPIKFKTRGNEKLAFLDPITMIISPIARKAPCAEFRKQYVKTNDRVLEVDQLTGQVKEVTVRKLKKFNFSITMPKIPIHTFHHLVLTNITDLATHAFVTNMVRVSTITYTIQKKDTEVLTTMSEEWKDVKDEIKNAVFGDILHIWDIIQFG
ncbi:unnamed protein product [Meloidogyne enterolobii]|uniref:Uncharacterized protein n=1 Tax=Meloidogyne enterolobii TaxID=390850 RepID=A0ACB0ZW37_MELEN